MLPTLLNFHCVYILPVIISIIHGCILALQKSVQVHRGRTRMRLLAFVRTLSSSWLQSCTVTIPTAQSELCGCVKTPIKWDGNVSEMQKHHWKGPSFLNPQFLHHLRAHKLWAPLHPTHTYPYMHPYWAKTQDKCWGLELCNNSDHFCFLSDSALAWMSWKQMLTP